MVEIRTRPVFPMKYAAPGIGVPRSRLSRPSSRSVAMEMPRYWKLVDMIPPPMQPGGERLAHREPVPGCLAAEDRAEQHQQDGRQREHEDHGLLLAEERP